MRPMPRPTALTRETASAEVLPGGCLRIRRGRDERAWPRATRDYSRLRGAISTIPHG